MAPNAANSHFPARNRAGDESQESQDLLIQYMLEHGLGVVSGVQSRCAAKRIAAHRTLPSDSGGE